MAATALHGSMMFQHTAGISGDFYGELSPVDEYQQNRAVGHLERQGLLPRHMTSLGNLTQAPDQQPLAGAVEPAPQYGSRNDVRALKNMRVVRLMRRMRVFDLMRKIAPGSARFLGDGKPGG